MSKEDKKVENTQSPLERFSNNNANLKRYLGLALKNTREIMKLLLPKIAVEVRNVIQSCVDVQKNQVQTTKSKKLINEKALIEQMYDLVGYKRREEKNGAFEIVVHRAIKLGKMMVDYPKQFDVDEKNSKIFVMSKVATPFIIKKLEGQKSNTEKLANTDEKLVEVNTGVIDRVHKVKYGGGSKGAKDKNILLDTKLKSISNCWNEIRKIKDIWGSPKMFRKSFSSLAKDTLGNTGKATKLTGHELDSTLDKFYYRTHKEVIMEDADKVAKILTFPKVVND